MPTSPIHWTYRGIKNHKDSLFGVRSVGSIRSNTMRAFSAGKMMTIIETTGLARLDGWGFMQDGSSG